MKTVASINVGESGVIDRYTDEQLASKLLSMGVLPGSRVAVLRKVPFKGTYYLNIEGQRYALRHREAGCIVLK